MSVTTFPSIAEFANLNRVTNLRELSSAITDLVSKGQSVRFDAEELQFDEAENAANLLLMQKLGDWEKGMVKDRRRRGIDLAKKAGKYHRPRSIDPDGIAWMIRQLSKGMDKSKIAKELGVSRETLYKTMRKAAQAIVTSQV
jgi:DNA invertase Pin-like site-specific DNA recombinase